MSVITNLIGNFMNSLRHNGETHKDILSDQKQIFLQVSASSVIGIRDSQHNDDYS